MTLYKNIFDSDQCTQLVELVNSWGWLDSEKTKITRLVQHYGYNYPYKGGKVTHLVKLDKETPNMLKCLGKALVESGLFIEGEPNQYIINQYIQRQGIGAHTDHESYFGNEVATLSLGAEVKMSFKRKDKTGKLLKISLPIGSILVFKDDARYLYTHEIKKTDTKNIDMNPRISITFRTVKMSVKQTYTA